MKKTGPCDICDGRLVPRKVTVDDRRHGRLMLIEGVPSLVCNQCGERYFSAATVRALEGISKAPKRIRTLRVPVAKFEPV